MRESLRLAGHMHPSSKLSSRCAFKLETRDLGIRQWECPGYKVKHKRDINAVISRHCLRRGRL